MKLKNQKSKYNKGFVILFATVVSSIILLITTSMYNLSKKQIILSSYARESQRAFYASNSALECALYNDISKHIIKTAFPVDTDPNTYSGTINCGGNDVEVKMLNVATTGNDGYTHSFVFRFPGIEMIGVNDYNSGCAYVLVEKKKGETINGVTKINTRITAAGFNACKYNSDDGYNDIPDYDNPTLLERRISSTYDTSFYENI